MADNAMVQGASKHGRPLLVLAGHTVVLGQDLGTYRVLLNRETIIH